MFKFTIRDLLWLTVVVALGVAWWVDRSRLVASNRALITRLDALNPNWRTIRRAHGPQLPQWLEP